MTKVMHGIQAARRATVRVWDRSKKEADRHRGQGLLLDLGDEGVVVLTCYHVIAPVEGENLCVTIPQPDGKLGEPIPVRYDAARSRPSQDAVVLRVDDMRLDERPLLHKLNLDKYNGALDATVLTHLQPNNFNAEVRPSTWLDIKAETRGDWPGSPERYGLRAFRLRTPDDARKGISGGVVLCEEDALGLVHFARAEGDPTGREDYLVPLAVWAEGWPALEELIEPLIDKNLRNAATVKPARELEIGPDVVIAGYRSDLYLEREVDRHARTALQQRGVVIVGKPKSGKTRLAWQLLREHSEALVVIPDSSRPPDTFEPSGLAGHELVIFFDDLHRVAETMQPLEWRRRLEEASEQRCPLICTTRDGEDWKQVHDKQELLLDDLGTTAIVSTSKIIDEWGEEKGEDFSPDQGLQLADALGSREKFYQNFDGTPGSLLLDLEAMRRRYSKLRSEDPGGVSMSRLLDSAKLLHVARQPGLRRPILRAVAEEIRGKDRMSPETWEKLERRTQEEGFAQFDSTGNLRIYLPYLEQCVAYNAPKEDIDQLLSILSREEDSDGVIYLGIYYDFDLNDNEQALACFDEALRLWPDFPLAWNNKGGVLRKLGRRREALEAYDQALRLWPDFPLAWNNKGGVLADLERYQEALEAYDQALRLWPDYTRASYNKAVALANLERYQEALELFDRVTSLWSDDSEAWYNKGAALGNLGRDQEALEALDRALRLEPDYSEAWRSKGLALRNLSRYQEALQALDRALTLKPDYPEAWYGIATV